MKKILFILLVLISLLITSCDKKEYEIVTTTFVGYDAARAVVQDDTNIKMLIKPGSDIHSYEPSATDIKAVLSCKLFIYVGGESDEWVKKEIIENSLTHDIKIINMFDLLKDELILEDEEEYDEHVWLNVKNYIKIVDEIKNVLCEIKEGKKEDYEKNANIYVDKLNNLDGDFKSFINQSIKKIIVVADRFPFIYFVKAYNLDYAAALSGCSQDKNAPISKIIELKNKIEENKLKYIFIIELSDGRLAETLKKEIDNDIKNKKYDGPNIEIKTFYSMQNISSNDFKNGLTYLDFMNNNLNTLILLNS